MDIDHMRKAVAAALTGAVTGSAIVYVTLPPEGGSHLPHWIYIILPFLNGAIGGLVTYFAPANKA